MKKIFVIFILLNLNVSGYGQTERLLVPSDHKQQTIVNEPVTLRKGYFRSGLLLNYRVADKYFDKSGRKEYYRDISWGSKASFGFMFQYGISDRFQIDLLTEYMNSLQGASNTEISDATNSSGTAVSKQKGTGFGDIHVSMKYQLIPEKDRKFSFTGRIMAKIPTGKKNTEDILRENQYNPTADASTYALGLNLSVRKTAYPYSFSGWAGYNYNFSSKKVISTDNQAEMKFRPGSLFESGMTGNIHLNEWIVFGNEINLCYEDQGKIENQPSVMIPSSWVISYEPGLIFQVHRFRLGESVRIPLMGQNIPADPLYLLFAQYIF